jgi:hypothetical protein
MNKHLSADQMAEWFAGERHRYVLDHLHHCPECQSEIIRFENSLSHFRTSVREWSGAQFDPSARLLPRTGPRPAAFAQPGWLTAALALLLFAVVTWHFSVHNSAASPVRANSDDLLLQQVDEQISRTVPTPMAPLTELVSWDGKQQFSTESR